MLLQAMQQASSSIPHAEPESLWSAIGGKVFISIISSSFTVLLMTVGKTFFDTKLLPAWLYYFRKNDQDINGDWAAHYDLDTGDRAVDKLTLKQFGHILEGTCEYTMTHKDTKKMETRKFILKGELKNDYLVLYYINESRSAKGLGTMALQIVDNGKTLQGHGIFYDTVLNKLDPQDYEYKRVTKSA